MDWLNNMSGIGRSGTGMLSVEGKEVARQNDGAHRAAHPPMGRDLRYRRRHWDPGG